MKVLVLGSGGREHALCWKIAQSPKLTKLWCAPGNPGTAKLAENVQIDPESPSAVLSLAREKGVELVVVGPEAPLVKGVSDALRRAGIPVFGPDSAAAELEGSKAFAKEIMGAAHVPTAGFRVFEDAAAAESYARQQGRIVVKADGLAAGKGVVVAHTPDEAVEAVRTLARTPAGKRLVLEELLEGEEVSVIALCDGERYLLLPPARDHKRVGDGDTGPNTGGMGAYAPAAWFSRAEMEAIGRNVMAPMLTEMRRRGREFRGALYAGLMLTAKGPRVIEFNCRFGDPETQVLMMQIDEDLLPLLDACARGRIAQDEFQLASGVSVGVVITSEGYPLSPKTGDVIGGLDRTFGPGVQVFHAGTKSSGGDVVSSGGRVLTVCANGGDLADARKRAYEAAERISLRGSHFRKDIAASGLNRSRS
jgi:phosphoribosylamine--glycine ligase